MYVDTRTPSGLIVRQESSDYRSVLEALQQHDPALRLVPQHTEHGVMWQVLRYAGGDRPAEIVTGWYDENHDPLPLSHGLVEKVKLLDRNTRGRQEDPDVVNRRRSERQAEREREESEDMARDFVKRTKRHPAFHRGIHLRKHGRLDRTWGS